MDGATPAVNAEHTRRWLLDDPPADGSYRSPGPGGNSAKRPVLLFRITGVWWRYLCGGIRRSAVSCFQCSENDHWEESSKGLLVAPSGRVGFTHRLLCLSQPFANIYWRANCPIRCRIDLDKRDRYRVELQPVGGERRRDQPHAGVSSIHADVARHWNSQSTLQCRYTGQHRGSHLQYAD